MLTARKKADVVELFSYDNNGNQTRTQRNGQQYRNISYTSRNKAKRINKKGKITTFAYNGNNRRYQRVDESQQLITYYVGNLELVIDNSQSAIGEQHYIKRYAAGENIGHPTINT